MDVSERLALADVFLIASAPSERQVNAIVDGIEDELSKSDLKPIRREGRSGGRWVLLDYWRHRHPRPARGRPRVLRPGAPLEGLPRRGPPARATTHRPRQQQLPNRSSGRRRKPRICPIWNFPKGCSKIFELLRRDPDKEPEPKAQADGVGATKIRGCGAAGSAPAWHAGGQGFESPQLHRIIRRNRKIPADFLCGFGGRGFGAGTVQGAPRSAKGCPGPGKGDPAGFSHASPIACRFARTGNVV